MSRDFKLEAKVMLAHLSPKGVEVEVSEMLEEIERLRRQVGAASSVPHLPKEGDYSSSFRLGHAVALADVTVAMSEASRE